MAYRWLDPTEDLVVDKVNDVIELPFNSLTTIHSITVSDSAFIAVVSFEHDEKRVQITAPSGRFDIQHLHPDEDEKPEYTFIPFNVYHLYEVNIQSKYGE